MGREILTGTARTDIIRSHWCAWHTSACQNEQTCHNRRAARSVPRFPGAELREDPAADRSEREQAFDAEDSE